MRGFSEAVAQRPAISQRRFSAGFTNLSGRFSEVNRVKATAQQLAGFLIFLFEEKILAIYIDLAYLRFFWPGD